MRLPFFKKQDDSLLRELQEMKDQWATMEEKLNQIEQQLQKSARVQYKTGKTLDEKLDTLTDVFKEERESTGFSNIETSSVIFKLISQIDDMDVVYGNLQEDSQWGELIKTWTDSMIVTLEQFGVYDKVRKRDLFDPALAEAIETVPISEQNRPLEVARVYTRTFINEKGAMIRKGQVATVKEE